MKLKSTRTLIAFGLFSGILAAGVLFYYLQLPYYTNLSVKLDESLLPYIDVSIENKEYPLMIDLGSRLEVDIHAKTLSRIKKHPHGTESWKNFNGIPFSAATFTIPRIQIGNLTFKKPVIVQTLLSQELEYFIDSSKQHNLPMATCGSLGVGLLKKVNMLLDAPKSQLILTNSINKLTKDGYDIQHFIPTPFCFGHKGHIILRVNTEIGDLRLMVDTGCTVTAIRKHWYPNCHKLPISRYQLPCYTASLFHIGNTNFGIQNIHFMDITGCVE